MKSLIYVDSHERLSIPLLDEAFEIKMIPLTVGDIFSKPYLVEVKIGQDIHDYHRLQDELSRMCEFKAKRDSFNAWQTSLHLCYCDTDSYKMGMNEMKRVYSWCASNGVSFHHDYYPQAMIATLKDIFKGNRDHKLIGTAKHKHLSTWENMLCVWDGISPEKAQGIAKLWNHPGQYWGGEVNKEILNTVIGTKKDGTSKKLTTDFLNFWFGGEQ